MSAIEDLIGRSEDLHPDLQACLHVTPIGAAIKHPLVNAIMHIPELNALANAQLAQKRKDLAKATRRADWDSYIFIHERPWRLNALEAIEHEITDVEYWRLLGRIWIDSENIREMRRRWERHLRSERVRRHEIMLPEEAEALSLMGERLEIWQGCTVLLDDGWSWTLSRDTAQWFARRFSDMEGVPAKLRHGWVERSDVLAYFTRRNESEILVAPELVSEMEVSYE